MSYLDNTGLERLWAHILSKFGTEGTSTTLGTTKLYNTTGTNTDGTITQAKLTELIGDVESLLATL